jgi:heterodisulfide reductase subunit C
MALQEKPEGVPRKIRAFHQSFLDQIHAHGRVFEFGLVASYKLRSGALFDDIAAAPAMIARGKLAFSPNTIDGVGDVRRIFDACLSHSNEEEQ